MTNQPDKHVLVLFCFPERTHTHIERQLLNQQPSCCTTVPVQEMINLHMIKLSPKLWWTLVSSHLPCTADYVKQRGDHKRCDVVIYIYLIKPCVFVYLYPLSFYQQSSYKPSCILLLKTNLLPTLFL